MRRSTVQNGDDAAVPDFCATCALGHHKPMALSETSAIYNEAQAGRGATNLDIKQDWIAQAFNPVFATRFPLLKMENWFEYPKPENGITGTVDWRVTTDPQLVSVLRRALASRFIFAARQPIAGQGRLTESLWDPYPVSTGCT